MCQRIISKNNLLTHQMYCMKSPVITHADVVLLFSLVVLLIHATVHQAHRTVINNPQAALARDLMNEFKSPILMKLWTME